MLSDAPATSLARVGAFNHLLGTCGVTLFAADSLAERYRKDFPRSIDGAPMLLPVEGSTLRRSLEQWFDAQGLRPRVVGEFQDSALMKTFGQAGAGVFAAPSAIEKEVEGHYRTLVVGRPDGVTERFYAISVERRLKNPAVLAICEAARESLFAGPLIQKPADSYPKYRDPSRHDRASIALEAHIGMAFGPTQRRTSPT